MPPSHTIFVGKLSDTPVSQLNQLVQILGDAVQRRARLFACIDTIEKLKESIADIQQNLNVQTPPETSDLEVCVKKPNASTSCMVLQEESVVTQKIVKPQTLSEIIQGLRDFAATNSVKTADTSVVPESAAFRTESVKIIDESFNVDIGGLLDPTAARSTTDNVFKPLDLKKGDPTPTVGEQRGEKRTFYRVVYTDGVKLQADLQAAQRLVKDYFLPLLERLAPLEHDLFCQPLCTLIRHLFSGFNANDTKLESTRLLRLFVPVYSFPHKAGETGIGAQASGDRTDKGFPPDVLRALSRINLIISVFGLMTELGTLLDIAEKNSPLFNMKRLPPKSCVWVNHERLPGINEEAAAQAWPRMTNVTPPEEFALRVGALPHTGKCAQASGVTNIALVATQSNPYYPVLKYILAAEEENAVSGGFGTNPLFIKIREYYRNVTVTAAEDWSTVKTQLLSRRTLEITQSIAEIEKLSSDNRLQRLSIPENKSEFEAICARMDSPYKTFLFAERQALSQCPAEKLIYTYFHAFLQNLIKNKRQSQEAGNDVDTFLAAYGTSTRASVAATLINFRDRLAQLSAAQQESFKAVTLQIAQNQRLCSTLSALFSADLTLLEETGVNGLKARAKILATIDSDGQTLLDTFESIESIFSVMPPQLFSANFFSFRELEIQKARYDAEHSKLIQAIERLAILERLIERKTRLRELNQQLEKDILATTGHCERLQQIQNLPRSLYEVVTNSQVALVALTRDTDEVSTTIIQAKSDKSLDDAEARIQENREKLERIKKALNDFLQEQQTYLKRQEALADRIAAAQAKLAELNVYSQKLDEHSTREETISNLSATLKEAEKKLLGNPDASAFDQIEQTVTRVETGLIRFESELNELAKKLRQLLNKPLENISKFLKNFGIKDEIRLKLELGDDIFTAYKAELESLQVQFEHEIKQDKVALENILPQPNWLDEKIKARMHGTKINDIIEKYAHQLNTLLPKYQKQAADEAEARRQAEEAARREAERRARLAAARTRFSQAIGRRSALSENLTQLNQDIQEHLKRAQEAVAPGSVVHRYLLFFKFIQTLREMFGVQKSKANAYDMALYPRLLAKIKTESAKQELKFVIKVFSEVFDPDTEQKKWKLREAQDAPPLTQVILTSASAQDSDLDLLSFSVVAAASSGSPTAVSFNPTDYLAVQFDALSFVAHPVLLSLKLDEKDATQNLLARFKTQFAAKFIDAYQKMQGLASQVQGLEASLKTLTTTLSEDSEDHEALNEASASLEQGLGKLEQRYTELTTALKGLPETLARETEYLNTLHTTSASKAGDVEDYQKWFLETLQKYSQDLKLETDKVNIAALLAGFNPEEMDFSDLALDRLQGVLAKIHRLKADYVEQDPNYRIFVYKLVNRFWQALQGGKTDLVQLFKFVGCFNEKLVPNPLKELWSMGIYQLAEALRNKGESITQQDDDNRFQWFARAFVLYPECVRYGGLPLSDRGKILLQQQAAYCLDVAIGRPFELNTQAEPPELERRELTQRVTTLPNGGGTSAAAHGAAGHFQKVTIDLNGALKRIAPAAATSLIFDSDSRLLASREAAPKAGCSMMLITAEGLSGNLLNSKSASFSAKGISFAAVLEEYYQRSPSPEERKLLGLKNRITVRPNVSINDHLEAEAKLNRVLSALYNCGHGSKDFGLEDQARTRNLTF